MVIFILKGEFNMYVKNIEVITKSHYKVQGCSHAHPHTRKEPLNKGILYKAFFSFFFFTVFFFVLFHFK